MSYVVCPFMFSIHKVGGPNPSMPDPRFEEFTFPSLDDFVGGDRDEGLFCPIRALRKCLACTEQLCPDVPSLLIFSGRRKKRVS